MPTGGSIQEVSIGGRIFAVAADADVNRKLGGFTATVEANGNGTARKILTREPWTITGLTLSIDHDASDQEFLQAVADGTSDAIGPDGFAAMSVTHADGNTYQGRGTVTEAIEAASMNATAAVSLSGPNKLVKQ